jgi:hypothetical protein
MFGVTVVGLVVLGLSAKGLGERKEWKEGNEMTHPLTPNLFYESRDGDEKRDAEDVSWIKRAVFLRWFFYAGCVFWGFNWVLGNGCR